MNEQNMLFGVYDPNPTRPEIERPAGCWECIYRSYQDCDICGRRTNMTITILGNMEGRQCQFKLAKDGVMTECGEQAVGRAGNTYLCNEHLNYAAKMMGIPRQAFKTQRKGGKKDAAV